MRHYKNSAIEHFAQTVRAGDFDIYNPVPHQKLIAGAIGALTVIIVAAAILAAFL